jgi:hypothetical protein
MLLEARGRLITGRLTGNRLGQLTPQELLQKVLARWAVVGLWLRMWQTLWLEYRGLKNPKLYGCNL